MNEYINSHCDTSDSASSIDLDRSDVLVNDDLDDTSIEDLSASFISLTDQSSIDVLDDTSIADLSASFNSLIDQSSIDVSDDTSIADLSASFNSLTAQSSNDIADNGEIFNFKTKGLHMCNLNVRHILPKIDEIRLTLSHRNIPDIFGICESFLEIHHPDSLISVDGFHFFRKDRSETQKKSGGGLILYSKQSLDLKRRHDLECSNLESLWAEVTLPHSKPFLICTTYRPPNAGSEWIDLFEKEVSVAQTTGYEFLLMGDFNIDMKSCSNNKWLSLIQLFDMSQLIIEPTRITESTSSIIDHAYTSDFNNITESFVSSYSISDHFPICFTRKVNAKIPKVDHTKTSYRCFKSFDEKAFLEDLQLGLCDFEINRETVDEDFRALHAVVINCLDNHAPIKTRRVKSSYLPAWYTPEIGKARLSRDKSKRLKQWEEYKHYRNKTRSLIRKAKRQHFTNSVENLKDTSNIWRHLRQVNKGSTCSGKTLPDELIIDGEHYTDSNSIAVKFNEFFTSIAQLLDDTDTDSNDLDVSKLQAFVNSNVPDKVSFSIPFITSDQVLSYIRILDPSKATGLDGLGPRIIKLAANSISPFIATLINKSIISGTFPSQLKYAKVFPVFKGGSKSDPSNYRPISILPTISKIFEKHVNKHLMNYLNKYNLIHKSQSGFRQKHSCQTALVKLIDQWMSCIDKGDLVGSLFIDFRKAFDVVDHEILMKKLKLYKLSETSLSWFSSYLSERKQAVYNGQDHSEFIQIKSGVPQGSILGPTLFLLFLNDLPLFTKFCFCDFYADDATFHTHSDNLETIEHSLQTDGNIAKTWGKENKMHIYYVKTTCMIAGTTHTLREKATT